MRVAVIHPGYLGDTVFLGPAVRALKARWPEGRVLLCVTPRGAPAARLLPGCDEVLVFDKRGEDRGPLGAWRISRALRAFGAEVALVPHYSPRAGLVARLAGIPRRIGYSSFCNEPIQLDRGIPFVDRTMVLAERIGAKGDPDLALSVPTEFSHYADGVLAGASPPLVGIVPGAEWATKRWGAEHYATVARTLAVGGATIVILGGPGDRADAERIRERSGAQVFDTTGNSIGEAIAVLARCDVVVGGDTGLVHCARALARPTVIVFGPTAARRHRFTSKERVVTLELECQPCHDHGDDRCSLGHHDCMAKLAPPRVTEAVRALLDASRA